MFAHRTIFWVLFVALAALLGLSTGLSLELLSPDPMSAVSRLRLPEWLMQRMVWIAGILWVARHWIYSAAGIAVALFVVRCLRDPIADLTAIALKSIRQRLLASCMTALSVALGVALMVTILVINGVVTRMFNQSATGYDLVLGAKGSPMQLVLNTIYFMDRPIENVPYSEYLKIKQAKWVKHAIPFALGDTTPDGRFRVVGTIPEYFEVPYVPDKTFKLQAGTFIKEPHDAVLGSRVAREYGWPIGRKFPLAHGGNVEDLHTNNPFQVAGILAPTGTPSDRAVFVHLDGFYQIAGHEKPKEEAIKRLRAMKGQDAPRPGEAPQPEELDPNLSKEVTAILVRAKYPVYAIRMKSAINELPVFQAANPIEQISRLLRDVVRNIRTMLIVMTSLIIVVSGVSIFVSIYNSMADRRREIAIMRALGASRTTVFSIIVTESVLICLAGGLAGLLLGHALVLSAGTYIESRADILIDPWSFETVELSLLPALFVLAVIVGIVPGITAYRADVARGLSE